MTSDPLEALREGATTIFHGQHAAMRAVVRDLSEDQLNWKPSAAGGVNSIAQMLAHALEAERFLVGSAVGLEVPRDREAQFRVQATATDMLALIDQTELVVDGFLVQLRGEHLAQETTWTTSTGPATRSGAWWLLHAIEHSNEHVGQAHLTRQLAEGA